MSIVLLIAITLSSFNHVHAQTDNFDYQDYADNGQSNLYANYAAKQQQKAEVAVGGGGGGGNILLKSIALGGVSYYVGGKFHSGRYTKKLKKKHIQEQKTLYSQYYNDVYKLQQQNAEYKYLAEQYLSTLEKIELNRDEDAKARDYDEFKRPDIDGDDKISHAEFNMYVKNYLSNYPGLSESDYPVFEDFDHDGDGYIGFQEYAQQMALTVQKAEKDHYNTQKAQLTWGDAFVI